MTDKQIIRVAKGFTKGLLGKMSTVDKCFVVCSPLVSYLRMCGVDCELTEGELNEIYHHYWITLKDGRIIDPTADQFGLLNQWVKKPPSYYRQYTAKDYNDKIESAVRKFHKSTNQ